MKIPLSPIAGSTAATLKVPHIVQEQRKWCWAASAQMVLEHCGFATTQCDIAAGLLNKSCCRTPRACNVGCKSDGVDQIYNQFGINSQYQPSSLPFTSIQAEINAKRPIQVGLNWAKGGGHLAIITGWEQDTSGDWVRVNDPDPTRPRPVIIRYARLVQAYGQGSWVTSWTNLT
jgi:hypothetical protein